MSEKIVFTPAVKKRLMKARERLDYTSFGIISKIAREVGVERQYAQLVIKDENTFEKHQGFTARKIWFCLERELEKDSQLDHVERIITTLRAGKPFAARMGSRLYTFLYRRLKRLGIDVTIQSDGEAPAEYLFTPKTKTNTKH